MKINIDKNKHMLYNDFSQREYGFCPQRPVDSTEKGFARKGNLCGVYGMGNFYGMHKLTCMN